MTKPFSTNPVANWILIIERYFECRIEYDSVPKSRVTGEWVLSVWRRDKPGVLCIRDNAIWQGAVFLFQWMEREGWLVDVDVDYRHGIADWVNENRGEHDQA